MLADLLKIRKRVFLPSHDRGHTVKVHEKMSSDKLQVYSPTKCSLLQLFTPIQAVTKLQETNIILGDMVNEMSSRSKLTKSEFVVIFVVQDVHQRGQERM